MADKGDKGVKRKRDGSKSSKPSKKVAIEGDRNIQISVKDAGKWAPIIVSSAGVTVPSISFNPYTKPRANAPQRGGAITTTEVLLHSSEHPKLDYTVREEDTLQKHYVGVYDPKTGKLEVTEARKMEVRAAVRAHQATEEQVHKNALQSRIELGQLFGTKKARKAIASQSENAIGPSRAERGTATKLSATDSAVMSLMSAATKGMATAAELQEEADASKPRPKANLAATDVNDVYTPDNLLGVDMLKHIPIMDWTTAIAAKQEIVVGSRHVAARIQREADNIVNLKLLRYMQLLIDFISATRVAYGGTRKLPKRDVLRDALGSSGGGAMPEAVVESVKRRFSTAGAMSRFQADLLITHVCALAMAVDHFEVGVYELQEDLKLEGREMAKYFREIGARVAPLTDAQRRAMKLDKAAGAQRQVAKLKIPLEFPKASAGRKKR